MTSSIKQNHEPRGKMSVHPEFTSCSSSSSRHNWLLHALLDKLKHVPGISNLLLSVSGTPHKLTMWLKMCASKRNISALMVLIVMQVSVTCVWLALNGNSNTDSLKQTESDQNKPKRQNAVQNSIVVEPGALGTKTTLRIRQTPSSKTEEGRTGSKLSKEKSTRVQANAVQLKDQRFVSRAQMPQSKFLLQMSSSTKSYCDDSVDFYENMTAMIQNVIVDPSKAHTTAKGGEKIKDVLLQRESAEFYHMEKGLFNIENCSNMPDPRTFKFGHKSLQSAQISDLIRLTKGPYKTKGEVIHEYDSDFVIILTRYEYANVYWTVIDLYDTFLMMQLYNRTFQNTDLWILDAHPDTPLDGLFEGTFRRVFRLPEIQGKTRFKNLLPCFSRGKTPILVRVLRPLTLVDKFRSSVLSALGFPLKSSKDRERRCLEKNLNVLFIWRHNYVGHPRNPTGIVTRKISNEDELLSASRQHFQNYTIRGEQLDKHPVSRQLELISNADIMVGMHGAAFGFTVFMQKGAGVLEMWPRGLQGNWHMEYLAKRSGIHYQSWQNTSPENENGVGKSTKVSASAVNKKLEELSVSICQNYEKIQTNKPMTNVRQ